MKKFMVFSVLALVTAALYAVNMGNVTLYGGYNAWVLGQLLASEMTKNLSNQTTTNASVDGGGFSFGGEILVGQKTLFGLEVAYAPLFTMTANVPDKGKQSVAIVTIPVIAKAVFRNPNGFYGDMGLGLSWITAVGNDELKTGMASAFNAPSFTFKGGLGWNKPLASIVGLDIGAYTTIVFGDYGVSKGAMPVWAAMILFWQVGIRAGVSIYF